MSEGQPFANEGRTQLPKQRRRLNTMADFERAQDELMQDFSNEGLLDGKLIRVPDMSVQFAEETRVQIEVLRTDGTYRHYPVTKGEGWKIDTTNRLLIIGKGFGRKCIPLETIDYFSPIQY